MTSTIRAQAEPKAFTPEESCSYCASCCSCPLEKKQDFLTKENILPCKWNFSTSPTPHPVLVSMEHKANHKNSKGESSGDKCLWPSPSLPGKCCWGDTFSQCPHHFKAQESSYSNTEINDLCASALKSKRGTDLCQDTKLEFGKTFHFNFFICQTYLSVSNVRLKRFLQTLKWLT